MTYLIRRFIVCFVISVLVLSHSELLAQQGETNPIKDILGRLIPPKDFGPKDRNEERVWYAKPNDYFDSEVLIELCNAISKRRQDEVSKAIKNGVKINEVGKHGMTVLYWAYMAGNLEAFKLLLASGCDPDIKIESQLPTIRGALLCPTKGLSVLGNAVHSKMVREGFYEAGIAYTKSPNERTLYGTTYLHLACARGMSDRNVKHVRQLIALGADIELKDDEGLTPLQLASQANPWAVMELLKAGANAEVSFPDGTPFRQRIHEMSTDPENGLNEYYDRVYFWLLAHPPSPKANANDSKRE